MSHQCPCKVYVHACVNRRFSPHGFTPTVSLGMTPNHFLYLTRFGLSDVSRVENSDNFNRPRYNSRPETSTSAFRRHMHRLPPRFHLPQYLKHRLKRIGMGGLKTMDVIVTLSDGHLAVKTVQRLIVSPRFQHVIRRAPFPQPILNVAELRRSTAVSGKSATAQRSGLARPAGLPQPATPAHRSLAEMEQTKWIGWENWAMPTPNRKSSANDNPETFDNFRPRRADIANRGTPTVQANIVSALSVTIADDCITGVASLRADRHSVPVLRKGRIIPIFPSFWQRNFSGYNPHMETIYSITTPRRRCGRKWWKL